MRQEVYILDVPRLSSLSIIIERKAVLSCRLKIFPSQEIKFSVPRETSSEWIGNYLQSKKNWIAEKLEIFAKTKCYETTEIIRHGMSIRMLGQDMVFSVYKSPKNLVSIENKSINIGVKNASDEQKIKSLFETWWRKQAFAVYKEILDKFYPVIEKHNIKKPNLLVRKMKTLWGSSSPHNGSITINLYLLKAKKPCIEYVILHELVHFLYLHHNQQFYDFLTLYMPDWKDRKKTLDTDVVQGL